MSIANLPQLNAARSSSLNLAMGLETALNNQKVMLNQARDLLNDVGPGMEPVDILAAVGSALAMIDAATLYAVKVEAIKDQLYDAR